MQKIMEPAFEIIYLLLAMAIGIYILINAKRNKVFILFGVMALLLASGDAFHLIPRMIDLWGLGDENIVFYLGLGKLITSITMTIFYVLFYWVIELRYEKKHPLWLNVLFYSLAIVRIVLCALPFNRWTQADAPYLWGIYRNIPFVFMGIIIIVLSFIRAKESKDRYFRFAFLVITLSFLFYLLTVTLASFITAFGMMMIPKTVCYVWLLLMGFFAERSEILGKGKE